MKRFRGIRPLIPLYRWKARLVRGEDWEVVFSQRAAEVRRAQELGVFLPVRYTKANTTAQ